MKRLDYRRAWISVIASFFFLSYCMKYSVKGSTDEIQDYANRASKSPLEFTISKAEENNAWERAQSFVDKYCALKIQVLSDSIIETFNPPENEYGYYIVKTPVKDSVRIAVQCIPGKHTDEALTNAYAHICAYNIRMGTLPPVGMTNIEMARKLDVYKSGIMIGFGLAAIAFAATIAFAIIMTSVDR